MSKPLEQQTETLPTLMLNSLHLLQAVHHAQQIFIRGEQPVQAVFEMLLQQVLELTASEYGFIGKVLYTNEQTPYLKVFAMTNIAWNEETQALYEKHKLDGMEFHQMQSLYGHVLTSQKPYISNAPTQDPHRYGMPNGHPGMNAFLGVPIFGGGELLGMFGLANRPNGYEEELIRFLEPLSDACSVIIEALFRREEHEQDVAKLQLTQHELHRNEQILRSLVESQSHYMVRTDLQGNYTYVNQGFTQHFGFSGKIIGQSSLETIHPDDVPICIATVEFCLTHPGEMKPISLRKPLADGSYVETEWEFIAVCDTSGVPYEIQCVGRDITAHKRAERSVEELNRELQDLNTYLENRVATRTKELSDLNREKDEFLSIAAHDLKNPLAAIKLSAERIEMQVNRASYNAIPSIARTINLASERMLTIIERLLEMNQIESGDFLIQPEACSRAFIEELVAEHNDVAAAKGITIMFIAPDEASIYADKEALHHIVDNLLSNAIKYSPSWKTIYVRLLKRLSDDNTPIACLEVQDEGEGISEEDQKRLFIKFARLSSRPTAGEHSTGLGLSIVKKLVEMQHGRVFCVSKLGHGATFTVELPLL